MMGAVMNYDFGPKRHWRRWVWNRIAERTPDPRSALVLYLPGTSDFDRPVATSKGFAAHNMIGVERCESSRRVLRERGVFTINADFNDAVYAQSTKRAVGVVFGDFCCGLTEDMPIFLSHWLQSPHFENTVFAFNLLRGRDAESNTMRDLLKNHQQTLGRTPLSWWKFEDCARDAAPGMHRGLTLVMMAAGVLAWRMAPHVFGDEWSTMSDVRQEHAVTRIACAYFGAMSTTIGSYRSTSRQTFDSVVIATPRRGPAFEPQTTETRAHALAEYVDGVRQYGSERRPGIARASRASAAVLAHRTMQSHGTFPRSTK